MRRAKRLLRRPRARQLFCEGLEDRTVLSGGLLAAPLNLLAAAPLQAPTASAPTSTPTASNPLTTLLGNPVLQDLGSVTAPLGLNVNLHADIALPGVAHLDLAVNLGVSKTHGLLVQTTLNAGVSVLGLNLLSTSTGAAVGLGGSTGVSLGLTTTTTTPAGGNLLTLNSGAGPAVGGSTGLNLSSGGTGLLNNGGSPNLGKPGGTTAGVPGGGSIVTTGNSEHSGQGSVSGATGNNLAPVAPIPVGPTAAAPVAPNNNAATSVPVPAVGPTTGGLVLLSGGVSETTAPDFIPATAAGAQETTTAPVLLDGGAVDTLFLREDLLFGAGNDTDLSNVIVPELPAVPADQVVPTAEPVVSQGELYDGGTSLLPQGDGLAQNCVPFNVQSLDDALHNLLHQFQLLSWDFSGLLGQLAGSPWFVAMAVLAVTCEVYRRKVHKARQGLLVAGSDLTWFPNLTGSGSSEVS